MVMIGPGTGPWRAALQTASAATKAIASTLPAISGTWVVGQTLTCSTGVWKHVGPISYTYRWTRNGAGISRATGSSYDLGLADEGTIVGCNVHGTDSQGKTTVAASGARTVVHVTPSADGKLASQTFTEKTGVKTITAASDFTGQALSFALVVPPTGVTIDAATGLVSVDTDVTGPLMAVSITVRASNSGGQATSGFTLGVAAASAWSISGGGGAIVVAAAPSVAPPVAASGVGQLTITA